MPDERATTPRALQGLPVGELGFAEYSALLERGQELGENGTWVWFEHEQRSAWSPNARRILGHGEEDVVWLFDLVHPEDQQIRGPHTFASSTAPTTVEYRIRRHSDGALRWIRETGIAELGDDGRPVRVFGSITDITDQRSRAAEQEGRDRLQLERDLHDGAQQRLVALLVRLRLAREQAEVGPGREADLLADAEAQLVLALDELRELARGAHPAALGEGGLATAIRGLPAPSSLSVRVDDRGVGRLDAASERALYFAVSEAVQNTTKHARARSSTVTLDRTDDRAVVTVTDDGGGFEVREIPSDTGLGGIRERILELGGSFEIASAPGEGTTLVFAVPLREPV